MTNRVGIFASVAAILVTLAARIGAIAPINGRLGIAVTRG